MKHMEQEDAEQDPSFDTYDHGTAVFTAGGVDYCGGAGEERAAQQRQLDALMDPTQLLYETGDWATGKSRTEEFKDDIPLSQGATLSQSEWFGTPRPKYQPYTIKPCERGCSPFRAPEAARTLLFMSPASQKRARSRARKEKDAVLAWCNAHRGLQNVSEALERNAALLEEQESEFTDTVVFSSCLGGAVVWAYQIVVEKNRYEQQIAFLLRFSDKTGLNAHKQTIPIFDEEKEQQGSEGGAVCVADVVAGRKSKSWTVHDPDEMRHDILGILAGIQFLQDEQSGRVGGDEGVAILDIAANFFHPQSDPYEEGCTAPLAAAA